MSLSLHTDLAGALDGINIVLLIGGMGGAGKTTYAERLVDGSATSTLLEGYRGRLSRSESKYLPHKSFMPGGLIVEFASNGLHKAEQMRRTRSYVQALQHLVHVVGAHTIETTTETLIWRYLQRMRAQQYLSFGKLRTIAYYALTRGAQEDLASWKALLAECRIENVPLSLATPSSGLKEAKTSSSKATATTLTRSQLEEATDGSPPPAGMSISGPETARP